MLKHAQPNEIAHGNTTGSGQGGQFLGSDMRAAYGGGTALDGAGQVVGLIEVGPEQGSEMFSADISTSASRSTFRSQMNARWRERCLRRWLR